MKITPIDPLALLLPHLLTRWAGHNAPAPWFRLSGLGWCPEKQYLLKEGNPEAPTRPDMIRKQQIGNALENLVLAALEDRFAAPVEDRQSTVALMAEKVNGNEYEVLYFVGHLDGSIVTAFGYSQPEKFVVDSKATSGFAYRKYIALGEQVGNDRTITAYKTQVGSYALALPADGGLLAFRNRDTNSFDVVWEDSVYWWRLPELLPLVERGLDNYFNRDVRDVEPWECDFCAFAGVCSKKKAKPAADSELGYTLLTQYRAADAHYRQQLPSDFPTVGDMEGAREGIDKILDKARKALKELTPDKWRPFHDGFKLSWSASRLTITDTKKNKE